MDLAVIVFEATLGVQFGHYLLVQAFRRQDLDLLALMGFVALICSASFGGGH